MIQLMKNNVGDRTFENEPDRYSKPIRCAIYLFTALFFIPITLWMGVKAIGEKERIGDENIHL